MTIQEDISTTGVFLKGPNRLSEAMERRAERADGMRQEIADSREQRLESMFEQFSAFSLFLEIMNDPGSAIDRKYERIERMAAELRSKMEKNGQRWPGDRMFREPWVDMQTGLPRVGGGSISGAYTDVTGTPFSIATATKTLVTAIAPAGHGLALCHFDVCMDGVTSSAVPATLDVVSSTQGATGTSGVTPTITQCRGHSTGGSAPTGGSNYSAEPTTLVNLRKLYLPQLMGTYTYDFPLGREFECDSSGGTNKALGIRMTTTATVNVLGNLEVEALG